MRRRISAEFTRTALAALLGAELTVLSAAPWAGVEGALLSLLLALGPALTAAALVHVIARAAPRFRGSWQRFMIWALALVVALLVFSAGAGLANFILIDQALKPRMLLSYAVSAALGGAGSVAMYWVLRRAARAGKLEHLRPQRVAGWVLLLLGILSALFDALFLTHGYFRFHVALLLSGLTSFCALSYLVLGRTRARLGLAVTGGIALLMLVPALRGGSWESSYRAVLLTATFQQRLLLLARTLSDGDGDGFSSRLGGPDCSDTDALAFPLSAKGRDCLGWLNRSEQRTPPRAHVGAALPSASKPTLILLLTIDAFRCGFGVDEVPELLDACPHLTKLGKEGRLRLQAYTTYPATARALPALHRINYDGGPPSKPLLATWLKQKGWRTHGIAIPKKEIYIPIEDGFETIDDSIDGFRDSASSTSERTTDRILDYLAKLPLAEAQQRTFLWAHYPDPHAPYVDEPDQIWSFKPALQRFVREVERTDRALGRLAEALRQRPDAARLFVLVTADHGEGLGEKGAQFHGAAINEPAVRIPMLAWSPNSDWLQHSFAQEIPTSIGEAAAFLAAVAEGEAFTSIGEAFFRAHVREGDLFGLVRDGWKLTHHQAFGWTELYDLRHDPREERNLASSEPTKLAEMIARIAPHLRDSQLADAL